MIYDFFKDYFPSPATRFLERGKEKILCIDLAQRF
jgi:hypothetical protein